MLRGGGSRASMSPQQRSGASRAARGRPLRPRGAALRAAVRAAAVPARGDRRGDPAPATRRPWRRPSRCPASLRALVAALLACSPEERPPSATAVKETLDAIGSQLDWSAGAPPRPPVPPPASAASWTRRGVSARPFERAARPACGTRPRAGPLAGPGHPAGRPRGGGARGRGVAAALGAGAGRPFSEPRAHRGRDAGSGRRARVTVRPVSPGRGHAGPARRREPRGGHAVPLAAKAGWRACRRQRQRPRLRRPSRPHRHRCRRRTGRPRRRRSRATASRRAPSRRRRTGRAPSRSTRRRSRSTRTSRSRSRGRSAPRPAPTLAEALAFHVRERRTGSPRRPWPARPRHSSSGRGTSRRPGRATARRSPPSRRRSPTRARRSRSSLESDGLTELTLSRVGRLGTLTRRTVELRPGTYTVVGSRRGLSGRAAAVHGRVRSRRRPVVSVRCEEAL